MEIRKRKKNNSNNLDYIMNINGFSTLQAKINGIQPTVCVAIITEKKRIIQPKESQWHFCVRRNTK